MRLFQFFATRQDNRHLATALKNRAFLRLEALETRALLSTASISGFVYNDANNNGLYDPGEMPIANSPIELHDASNQLVAATTTDANGFYSFNNDLRINANPTNQKHTIAFPDTRTDWSATQPVPQFDPSLGTLTSVEIVNSDAIKDTFKAENLDTAAATVHATVTGDLTLSGPSVSGLDIALSADQTFDASAFDGTIDFGGASGKTFAPQTINGSNSTTLTSSVDLAKYTGTGTVSFTETAHANSAATGPANLLVQLKTSAAADATIIYHYVPTNQLAPGDYTIVQTSDPPGYLDGQVTAGNVTPVPNSAGSNVIHVTLGNTDLANNDFAEVKPASPGSLSGFVYIDQNNNVVKDADEPGIANMTVTLLGTDNQGHAVNRTQTTGADGSYSFVNLSPGTYSVTESGTDSFLDGKDTAGSQGGTAGHDTITSIVLGAGVNGVNNNFGELQSASVSGFVYFDINNDGVRENEPGVAGTAVTLSGVDDRGATVSLTTATAGNGSYGFNNLRPGDYAITKTQPAGWLEGKNAIGTQGGVVGTDQFSNIQLAVGESGINNNFGVLLQAILRGFVFFDANNSGIMNADEPGVPGVTITLTGVNDLGQSINIVQTTDVNGAYAFGLLRPGTYAITETHPAGLVDGQDSIGSQGGSVAQDRLFNIQLGSGINGVNNNFAETLPLEAAVARPTPSDQIFSKQWFIG
jgi:protocatechuate 3,4-dioxygenase beta subunit